MADDPTLTCHLRDLRERAGLSQQALGERVGVSRQAINAVEGGRQVPSTVLSLRLAQVLGVSVEALFSLPVASGLSVRTVGVGSERVLLGRVRGSWVAHVLGADEVRPADGLLLGGARVEPLHAVDRLADRLLVAGCAPLLALLGHRPSAGVTWLSASTGRALDWLDMGLVHVAGLHAWDPASQAANLDLLRARLRGRPLVVVHLTRWRQGILTAPGNPLGIRSLADLARPGLRFARRGPGAGASRVVQAAIGELPEGPLARGHADVARLVQVNAADAGVAIEAVALAAGLSFTPLSEERFDLAFPADLADDPRVARLVETLTGRGFRAEASRIAGYDLGLVGQTARTDGEAA